MKKLFTALFISGVCLTSCEKEPGEGGNSSIKGNVWVRNFKNGSFLNEYSGADEDVYIIYGNDFSYGDRIKTDYKGNYEFKYLREGKYKIYVYSSPEDSTMDPLSGKVAVIKDVEITKKKQELEAPKITIYH